MNTPSDMLRLTGFRFPREIIVYAVWAYNRSVSSTADIEDLLAERGVIVTTLLCTVRSLERGGRGNLDPCLKWIT